MEREVLETFEAAKKAADAASGEADSPEADRCLDALRRLRAIRVNTGVLVSTQVSGPPASSRLLWSRRNPGVLSASGGCVRRRQSNCLCRDVGSVPLNSGLM